MVKHRPNVAWQSTDHAERIGCCFVLTVSTLSRLREEITFSRAPSAVADTAVKWPILRFDLG
jgi:hypothetical protein